MEPFGPHERRKKLKAAPLRLSCQANVEGDIACYTQVPVETTREIESTRCFTIISRARLEMVQEVVGNEFQRNVFLDLAEAEEIAREVAELYPDGNWEIREFADPLATQEFSFSYNPLRYIRPARGERWPTARAISPRRQSSPQRAW